MGRKIILSLIGALILILTACQEPTSRTNQNAYKDEYGEEVIFTEDAPLWSEDLDQEASLGGMVFLLPEEWQGQESSTKAFYFDPQRRICIFACADPLDANHGSLEEALDGADTKMETTAYRSARGELTSTSTLTWEDPELSKDYSQDLGQSPYFDEHGPLIYRIGYIDDERIPAHYRLHSASLPLATAQETYERIYLYLYALDSEDAPYLGPILKSIVEEAMDYEHKYTFPSE